MEVSRITSENECEHVTRTFCQKSRTPVPATYPGIQPTALSHANIKRMTLTWSCYSSASHGLKDADLIFVELSYESHLGYASPDAQQASSRDYSAIWRIAQRLIENYLVNAPDGIWRRPIRAGKSDIFGLLVPS